MTKHYITLHNITLHTYTYILWLMPPVRQPFLLISAVLVGTSITAVDPLLSHPSPSCLPI